MAEQRASKPAPASVRDSAPGQHSEDSQQEGDQPWRAIFEATLDGIFVVDDERRFVDANPAACVFFGLSRKELLRLKPAQLSAAGQDPDAAWKSFRKSGHLERTWRYRRSDGAIREAEVRSVANFTRGRHLAVVRDVTEQRLAQRALQESEERFRLAFDNAPIGMSLCSLDGRWLKVNRALCDLTGYAERELLQRTFQDITHPEDVDADLDFCRRLIAGEIESYSMEKRYFHKLGHVVWILLHASIARSEDGEPLYFVGQIKDISDARRAEEALRDSEQRYRQLFETNPLPMWLYDPDTLAFLGVNDAAIRQYGFSRDEFLGMTVKDIRPPEELGRFLAAVALGPQGVPHRGVWRHRKKDGSPFDAEISVDSLRLAGREARIVVSRDVTERRRAEQALRAHARREAVIADLGQRALQGLELSALMSEAAALAALALDVELVQILELRQRGRLLLRAGTGWKEGLAGRASVAPGTGSHAGFTLAVAEPVILENIETERRFSPSPLLRDHGAVCGVCVTIAGRDLPFGVLGAHATRARRFTADDVHFLQALANVLASAIIRRREEDVRRGLFARVISAQEDERRRIARELHDETGQVLTSLLVGLRAIEDAPSMRLARARTSQLRAIAARAIDAVGNLARGLHPTVLLDLGLGPALARHASEQAELLGIEITLDARGLGSHRFTPEVETSLFRIAQEAIANVGKHARATRAALLLKRKHESVELTVEDDGCGFRVERMASGRLGLHDIRERAALLGGKAQIDSKPGKGTRVSVRVPLEQAATSAPERP